ncbi:MAG: phthalyl amidase [Acidimicrobiia bacterium]|nr:phthalyl amidase [Acidimicrobiia bacterium]
MRKLMMALVAVLVVLGMMPAVGAAPKPKYVVNQATLDGFTALPGATGLTGILNGAGYLVEVPDDWNGDLVMWAHGYAGEGLVLDVSPPPLREWLIANGFAWAASSYSKNSYNVAQGAKDTHSLAMWFNGHVGKAENVYIAGASMGGHVTGVSIEQYPIYDAAMPVCGVMADFELFDFFLDFNMAAQTLGGVETEYPIFDGATYLTETAPEIQANLEAFPGGWPLFLNEDGTNLKNLTELRSGGDRPNFDEAWFFWNEFASFAGPPGDFLFDIGVGDGTLAGRPGTVSDNTGIVYQFDTDPALSASEQDLNDAILRVAASPQARHPNGLANIPVISGDIDIPVLTMHNLGDLFVPFHMETIYGQRVADHGKSDLLVQRAIRGVVHCDFTGAELATGFSDLQTWLETGVKPDGDDVLDPDAVAAADFGCAFTEGPHLFGVPCP